MATDLFGALALDTVPVPVRESAIGYPGAFIQPAGDPLLYYVSSFLQTIINSRCGAAYAALDPRPSTPALNGLAVIEVDYVDPADHSFNARDLPAIYMYRDTFPASRIADDMYVQKSHLACHWVPRPDNLQRRQEIAPFVNAIAMVINRAIIRGRDPSWIVPGDTDTQAAYFGSSLVGWTGADRPFALIESKRTTITIAGHEGEYTGLKVVLQAEELLHEDPALRYFTPTLLDQTISQQQAGGDGTSAYLVSIGDYPVSSGPLPTA
jgi:hypothetical protein